MANTAFISYILVPTGLTTGNYSQAVHCNYFKTIDLGEANPYIQEISLNFPNADDFKFLTGNLAGGTGYSVNEPVNYAVRAAIEQGVIEMVFEGKKRNMWKFKK